MRARVLAAGALAGAVLAAGLTATTDRGPAGNSEDPDQPRSVIAAAPGRTGDSADAPDPLAPHERRSAATDVVEALNGVVPDTRTGLAVYDRRAGTTVVDVDADSGLYTASVVKLLIAVDVLHQHGWRSPDQATARQLTGMLSASDDSAATTLWNRYGGSAIVDRAADLLRLSGTTPPSSPDQWELTRMSPRDIVRTYTYVADDMPRPGRDTVLDALANLRPTAHDGFDQRFGLATAFHGRTSAVKQGWMPVDDAVVLNTTGIVGAHGRYVVALLTELPAGTGFATAREALTSGARALADAVERR